MSKTPTSRIVNRQQGGSGNPPKTAERPAPAVPAAVAPLPAPAAAVAPAATPGDLGGTGVAAAAPVATGAAGAAATEAVALPRGAKYGLDWVVTVRSLGNPKRPASQAFADFSYYKPGMTVRQYLEDRRMPRRRARANLAWDLSHGFAVAAPPVVVAETETAVEAVVEDERKVA